MIAAQQATLDLAALTGDDDTSVVEPVATTPVRRRQTVLYAHASLTELLHLGILDDGTRSARSRGSAPPPSRRSATGWAAPTTWSSDRCST